MVYEAFCKKLFEEAARAICYGLKKSIGITALVCKIEKIEFGVTGVWGATSSAELAAICLSLVMFGKYKKKYGYERSGLFMVWIFGIVLIAGVKTLLCKGFSLGIFLLLFWIKGRKLKFCSDEWDNFFLQMSPQSVQRYVIAIYTVAAVISSAISYAVLEWAGYEHSFGLTLLLFIGGVIITAYKWNKKGKDYLLKRYQEIPQTILARKDKKNENSSNKE